MKRQFASLYQAPGSYWSPNNRFLIVRVAATLEVKHKKPRV